MTVSPDDIPWTDIGAATGRNFGAVQRLHGDGAAIAWRVEDEACGQVFVKTTTTDKADDLVAERDGIECLSVAATGLRVPRVIVAGVESRWAFLVLEYLQLAPLTRSCAARMGTGLAALHRHCGEHFGWHRDNLLGRSVQTNRPGNEWLSFWREQRLEPQLHALATSGASSALQRACNKVHAELEPVLAGHRPQPSLLHGDLWSGNMAQDENGMPVIFDPAAYRGDREVDIAMTSLFGGVPDELEQAYRAAWPLPSGHERRRLLYNLHHAVNHVLLFGAGWESLALQLASGVVARR